MTKTVSLPLIGGPRHGELVLATLSEEGTPNFWLRLPVSLGSELTIAYYRIKWYQTGPTTKRACYSFHDEDPTRDQVDAVIDSLYPQDNE